MKWLIKNPAPLDSRLKKWGDYHFGRCLTKYLERLGHEVVTEYDPKWNSRKKSDVVLVLRGKYPHKRTKANRNAFHVMWNISHPESVELDEYASYDMVFVASEQWASQLRERIDVPVFPLLQCTDTEEFFEQPLEEGEGRRDFIFVGNSRGVRRDGVVWALEYGIPLKIWGRLWKDFIDKRHLVGDYIDNEELGALYSRSRATLNDHWDDMKKFGFINNRIFDAIACGLPVISDYHPALHQLFPEEILYYRNREELGECLERVLLAYPEVRQRVARGKQKVVEEYSFARRARVLSDMVTGTLTVRSNPLLQGQGAGGRLTLQKLEEIVGSSKDPLFCPICHQHAERFRSFGRPKRKGAMCPVCGSLERHRLIWLFINAKTDLLDSRPKKLLHVAPEKHLSSLLYNFESIEYMSADILSSSAMVRMDLTAVPFPDESFDVVICNHVFEHIPNDRRAMTELHRILRPGGWAILQVPIYGERTLEDPSITDPGERRKLYGQEDHVRKYGRDYKERLGSAGFNVSIDSFADELTGSLAAACGIKAQDIYFCSKGKGLRCFCPVCDMPVAKFQHYSSAGRKGRADAQCPHCKSLERHRLIWLYLERRTDLFSMPRKKMLHIAPEAAFDQRLSRHPAIDYLSGDLESPWHQAMVKMDITDIQNSDNTFDVIFCSDVLEHVPEDRKAIAELFRVLKPGGWAILNVPVIREKTFEDPSITTPEERHRHYGHRLHVRAYGKDYKDRLEEAGFKVRVDAFFDEFDDAVRKRYGLRKQDIYYCEK